MRRLEEFTPEQSALIPAYREKWRAIALSTERIDWQQATDAVIAAYTAHGYAQPEILLFDNPLRAAQALAKLRSQGGLAERADFLVQNHNHWSFSLPQRLSNNLEWQLHNDLKDPLGKLGYIEALLNDYLEFENGISSSIVYSGANPISKAGFYGVWDFYFTGLNFKVDLKKWQTSLAVLQTCGWIFAFKDVCAICDRPAKISLNAVDRLHAVGKPALLYADGFGIHAYHGTLLPKRYIDHPPETWKPAWYLREQQPGIRRAFIELVPLETLQVDWLFRESSDILRPILLHRLGLNNLHQRLRIQDDFNLLEQALQLHTSPHQAESAFWVAWTLLEHRNDPSLQPVWEAWAAQLDSRTSPPENRFVSLRQAVLADALKRIAAWFDQNLPYTGGFFPGLPPEKLHHQISSLPFYLPDEVYELYQRYNGAEHDVQFVYHEFYKLDDAIQRLEHVNELSRYGSPEQNDELRYVFPLFTFDGEFFAVVATLDEVDTAPIRCISPGSDNDITFNSLTTMLLTIAEAYETGVYQLNEDEYLSWADKKKFGQLRLKYNPGTTAQLYSEGG